VPKPPIMTVAPSTTGPMASGTVAASLSIMEAAFLFVFRTLVRIMEF
jgi:hypothetical protein